LRGTNAGRARAAQALFSGLCIRDYAVETNQNLVQIDSCGDQGWWEKHHHHGPRQAEPFSASFILE